MVKCTIIPVTLHCVSKRTEMAVDQSYAHETMFSLTQTKKEKTEFFRSIPIRSISTFAEGQYDSVWKIQCTLTK
jgi:hypothetical protein